MLILQETFDIPYDIATGLMTGIYNRTGGVIRHAVGSNKGQIVKHLQPIDLKAAEQAHGFLAEAMQLIQHNKKELGIVAGVAMAGGGIIWVYKKLKNHEPKVLTEFRAALKTYIDAIRNGNMDIDKINGLMQALKALKKRKNCKKISVQLSLDDLKVLLERIYDYTIKLASDNDVELSDDEFNLNNGAIINLQSYLEAQKRIFKGAS